MLVSIIMPTYNCGKYISESLESVIAQTISDWEIQIVDDCSTDNTYEIVKAYMEKHPTIHYYKLPENSGPAIARTEAIKRASGKYVAFLDSDDLWMPEKLEKQIAFMETNKAVFSCTAYTQICELGYEKNVILIPPTKVDYKKCLQLSDPIGNLTVMYNQEVLGKYEVPPIKKRNDFALWLRILHDAPYCIGLPEVLAIYRVRKNSLSSNKLEMLQYHWQLYYQIESLNIFQSTWYVICWIIVKGTGVGIDRRKS